MDTFLENAQRIFDVARNDRSGENSDFALLVLPDGSLHMVMEAELNLDAVAAENGARMAYRVSRSQKAVRVSGRNGAGSCEFNESRGCRELLRDRPLYLIVDPVSDQALIASA